MMFVVLFFSVALAAWPENVTQEIFFPSSFVWGAATSAYQIEGAWDVDGRGPSIWDTFCNTTTDRCAGDTGDVACDHYNRVKEDVVLLTQLGVNSYRMSLSWSRILPKGRGEINQKGIDHYNMEIDALKAAGIHPYVTLYHWDLPQALEDEGGWLVNSTIDAFVQYANLSFSLFGDRVKNWATFNEPLSFAQLGNGDGSNAPGRCSNRSICAAGNSSTEPYIVGHSILLAHARSVKLYRSNYQKTQRGKIGLVVNSDWSIPLNESSPEDQAAATRYLEFSLGWFADPIMLGDYPDSMKKRLGDRLPKFSSDDRNMLNRSVDVFYLNHYTSSYAYPTPANASLPEGWARDTGVTTTRFRDGKPIGPKADSDWLYVYPQGIRSLLSFINKRYNSPLIIITENGVDAPGENEKSPTEALDDVFRVQYFHDYLTQVALAMSQDNVQVRGYFAWSMMDNFEWGNGLKKRFGLIYVNYNDNAKRTPKMSADFYGQVIAFNKRTYWPWLFAFVVPGLVLFLIVVIAHYYNARKSSVPYSTIN